MNEKLLREYIKQQLMQERLLRSYVHAILAEYSFGFDPSEHATMLDRGGMMLDPPDLEDEAATSAEDVSSVPPPPLRDVVETALANNSTTFDYTVEDAPRTASEVYARFSSSDVRDSNMGSLKVAIETEVANSYPEAIFSLVKLTKHSRKVLRIVDGRQKVTVAFKGASVGGAGLEFETALFAVLKVLPSITSKKMTKSERRRLENGFGIDRKLKDEKAVAELVERIKDPDFLSDNASMAGLLSRAAASLKTLTNQFTSVAGVTRSGGEGGKADLVIEVPGKGGEIQGIDISLKHEKDKAGTNLFIFNKDLGDGTKDGKRPQLGRNADNIKQFDVNLIQAPGNKPWWQIARLGIIKSLKKKLGKAWNLSSSEETDFVSKHDASSLNKVKALFDKDKEDGGAASKVPRATMKKAASTFMDSLKTLDPIDVLSLIEESQLGAESKNPLYKLTSSGAGSKLKQVSQSSAKQQIDAGTLKPADLDVEVGRLVGKSGSETTSVEIKLVNKGTKEVLARLIIRGLKFRSSVFSTSLSDLKIKTRA